MVLVSSRNVFEVLGVASDYLQRSLDVVRQRVDEIVLEDVVLIGLLVIRVRLDGCNAGDADTEDKKEDGEDDDDSPEVFGVSD